MEGMTTDVEAEYVVLAGPGAGGGSVSPLPSVAGPRWSLAGVAGLVTLVILVWSYTSVINGVGVCSSSSSNTALLRRVTLRGRSFPVLQNLHLQDRGGPGGGGGRFMTAAVIGGEVGCWCWRPLVIWPRGSEGRAGRAGDSGDLIEDASRIQTVLEVYWLWDERSYADGTSSLSVTLLPLSSPISNPSSFIISSHIG